MKWELPIYEPSEVLNQSSRKSHSGVSVLGDLSMEGSLDFGDLLFPISAYTWVTFANTGAGLLKLNGYRAPSNLVVHGGIPDVLNPGDWFKLKITALPTRIGLIEGMLTLLGNRRNFEFPYQFNSYLGNFLYNDSAYYDSTYYYNGKL